MQVQYWDGTYYLGALGSAGQMLSKEEKCDLVNTQLCKSCFCFFFVLVTTQIPPGQTPHLSPASAKQEVRVHHDNSKIH